MVLAPGLAAINSVGLCALHSRAPQRAAKVQLTWSTLSQHSLANTAPLSPEPYNTHRALEKFCIALGSLVLSVFSTSWGQIYALLCFALPVFIPKPTKTPFVLQSKSPMTWDPYFWARGELKTWVCQIICGTCWWQMVYKHLFSYYSRRENSWESKSFLIFLFFQKFKLMNGKNQQTSEILFDKQDFVLKKKKERGTWQGWSLLFFIRTRWWYGRNAGQSGADVWKHLGKGTQGLEKCLFPKWVDLR